MLVAQSETAHQAVAYSLYFLSRINSPNPHLVAHALFISWDLTANSLTKERGDGKSVACRIRES